MHPNAHMLIIIRLSFSLTHRSCSVLIEYMNSGARIPEFKHRLYYSWSEEPQMKVTNFSEPWFYHLLRDGDYTLFQICYQD